MSLNEQRPIALKTSSRVCTPLLLHWGNDIGRPPKWRPQLWNKIECRYQLDVIFLNILVNCQTEISSEMVTNLVLECLVEMLE